MKERLHNVLEATETISPYLCFDVIVHPADVSAAVTLIFNINEGCK